MSLENRLKHFHLKRLNVKCPQFSNPADFYIEILGVDIQNQETSRQEIQVNIKHKNYSLITSDKLFF